MNITSGTRRVTTSQSAGPNSSITRLGRAPNPPADSAAKAPISTNSTLVPTLSVPTKESWKDAGDWQSHTEWHRIVVLGKLAEYAKTLTKGTHVMVQGSLRSREYEKDG